MLLYRWPKPSGRGPRGRRPLLPALVELQVQEKQRSSGLQPSKFSLSVSLFLESRREGTSLGRPRFESRLSKLLCILAAGPWAKKSLDLSESQYSFPKMGNDRPETQFQFQFSRSIVSNSLRPHGLQQARPSCPSPTPGVYPDSCPLSW